MGTLVSGRKSLVTYPVPGAESPAEPTTSSLKERAKASAKPSIVLIDPRRLTREALCFTLQAQLPTLEVHAIATALELAERNLKPAAVLLNLGAGHLGDKPVQDDLAELKWRQPQTPVLLISDGSDSGEALSALQSGFRGVFPASLSTELLASAVRLVIAGGIFLAPELLKEWSGTGH